MWYWKGYCESGEEFIDKWKLEISIGTTKNNGLLKSTYSLYTPETVETFICLLAVWARYARSRRRKLKTSFLLLWPLHPFVANGKIMNKTLSIFAGNLNFIFLSMAQCFHTADPMTFLRLFIEKFLKWMVLLLTLWRRAGYLFIALHRGKRVPLYLDIRSSSTVFVLFY